MGKKAQQKKRNENPVIRAEAALTAAEKALASAGTRTGAALANFHQALNLALDGIDARRHQALVAQGKKVKLALKDVIEARKQALSYDIDATTRDSSMSQLPVAA